MATRKLTPTKPHFFRPLLPGFQNQLVIPVSFYLKHLNEKKAEKAVLRSPGGKFWHVKMNGRVIEDGWEEFAEDHDLHVGDILIFRLESDLVFQVLVFDPTSCLREYPNSFHVKEETETETPLEEEIPNQSTGFGKLRKKKKDLNFERKVTSSVPQHPYFVLNLTSYAANCAALTIPTGFARANGLRYRRCKIVLVNEEGKAWPAGLGFKQCDGQVYIKQSWTAFRCANSLKAGDSCIFELIQNGKKPVLKIRKCPEELKPNQHVVRAGACPSSRYLHVYVTVTESCINHYNLRIPSEFARKGGLTQKCLEEMIVQNERGRSWTVLLRDKKTGGLYIGLGWTVFARANGIKAGDVLKLELIKKRKMPVMRISVVEGVNRGAGTEKEKLGNS